MKAIKSTTPKCFHPLLPLLFLVAWVAPHALFAQVDTERLKESNENFFSRLRDYNPQVDPIYITLKSSIESGLRKNPGEAVRKYQNEILDLDWNDSFEEFWFPEVSLTVETDKQKLHHLFSGSVGKQELNASEKTPEGRIGLALGEYTLFNWGKDYLQYQIEKARYKRDLEILGEKKRDLKHQIISTFFNLSRLKLIKKIQKKHLQHITFIYRLAKERVSLRKLKKQEFYEVRSEYLKAQNIYYQSAVNAIALDEQMALILGDRLNSTYRTDEYLRFKKLDVPLNKAIQSSMENFPEVRENRIKLDNATRALEITRKDNLPLPKVTVNLGTYSFDYNRNGGHLTYETLENNANIEVIASINMTWKILGEDGLFNRRKQEKTFINKKISEIEFYNAKREAELSLRQLYQGIRHIENQYEVSVAQLGNTRKAFDIILDNYIAGSARFDQFKDALNNLTQSEIEVENIKLEHLNRKIRLANLMGVADLPLDSFEGLAQKVVK